MRYLIYNNCTEAEFLHLKTQLSRINSKLTVTFDRLVQQHRHDDSDFLNLNFSISKSDPFLGNLSILFEDLSQGKTFSVKIIKTIDLSRKRYFKKADIRTGISLEEIELNYQELINKALLMYDSWEMDDIISNENVDLEL
jgi:hypothetical protein